MYERIVVALDGSELAEHVLPHVTALAGAFHPTVTLVRTYEPPASLMAGVAASAFPGTGPLLDPGPAIEAGRGEAEAYLEGIATRLAAAGVPAEPVRLEGRAAPGILSVARERHATLIAMTTHGRGGLSRLVFGSVAEAVLRHAPCPVLLVRVDNAHPAANEDDARPQRERPTHHEPAARRSNEELPRLVGGSRLTRFRSTVAALDWLTACADTPCPVCGAIEGCCVVDGSRYARCRNVRSYHPIADGGWLHELHAKSESAPAAREHATAGTH